MLNRFLSFRVAGHAEMMRITSIGSSSGPSFMNIWASRTTARPSIWPIVCRRFSPSSMRSWTDRCSGSKSTRAATSKRSAVLALIGQVFVLVPGKERRCHVRYVTTFVVAQGSEAWLSRLSNSDILRMITVFVLNICAWMKSLSAWPLTIGLAMVEGWVHSIRPLHRRGWPRNRRSDCRHRRCWPRWRERVSPVGILPKAVLNRDSRCAV